MTDFLNKKHLVWFTICLLIYCKYEMQIFAIHSWANTYAITTQSNLFLFILSVPSATHPGAHQIHQ